MQPGKGQAAANRRGSTFPPFQRAALKDLAAELAAEREAELTATIMHTPQP